jgi:hypothetical protein
MNAPPIRVLAAALALAGTAVLPALAQQRAGAGPEVSPAPRTGLPPAAPAAPTAPRSDALGAGAGTLGSGVPAIGGVTPNRAELAGSAFGKLDAGHRGYVTLDDARQLDGFANAFRQADQNGDGRLDASEFDAAWSLYTGNAR